MGYKIKNILSFLLQIFFYRQLLYSDLPSKHINFRKYDITSSLDSDAELEESVPKYYSHRNKITQQFMSFILIMVLWFNKFLEFLKLKTVKRREYYATYEYQRYGIVH